MAYQGKQQLKFHDKSTKKALLRWIADEILGRWVDNVNFNTIIGEITIPKKKKPISLTQALIEF
jgi:hypothetical protein